jgi:membrane-associated phospholipid phosphatase
MSCKAAKTSALLCALFLLIYGGINRFTALRTDVISIYASWERFIPFVPLMIVPYMSIDLFFIAAPFFCRDDRQRHTLVRRIVTAILVSGACFLLFPLRCAFDRPHVDGPLGLIFNNFRLLDQPFNQFPSLHIALQVILFPIFASGRGRIPVTIWFGLIAASTVLTHQHHLIDIVGGAVLGTMCVQLFRDEDDEPLRVRFSRIGFYYAAGCAVLLIIATIMRPYGMFLLWPAMSLEMIAANYFAPQLDVYGKRNGQLSWLTRLLLGPVLIGQRLSLWHYARQSPAWSALTDRLLIGRTLSDREARSAINSGVTAVLDLTCEFSEARPFIDIDYLQLPVLDLTAPTREQVDRAVDFIRDHIDDGIVYIHCKAGYSRTAAVAGAYLISSAAVETVDEAIERLRSARPRMVVRPEAMRALIDYTGCAILAARTRRRSIVHKASTTSTSVTM